MPLAEGTSIRTARAGDLPTLREIEQAAGEPFRDLGMDVIADDEPPGIAALGAFQQDGRAWVAANEDDEPVAYLLAEVVDIYANIAQVSVHPAYARRRIGRRLLDVATQWAARNRLTGLTLTTFTEVPWNAPYYARLGFRVLREEEIPEGLRRIRADEACRGLDAWPRVTMLRDMDYASSEP